MITFNNIVKQINNKVVLNDISFNIAEQEIIVILGPSGSGKTTLLRAISGLDNISSGEILINDMIFNKDNSHLLHEKIGMVFQNFNLFPHMNIIDNLTYSPLKSSLMLNRDSIIEKAKILLNDFSLLSIADKLPKDISGGQKQRVAIARALMIDPQLLLMDEPTSALDPEIISDFVEIIKKLKNKLSIIITSHHIGFAKSIADKIIFMDRGLKLCEQRTEDFFIKPKSQRARLFLNSIKLLD
jgi:ABC-type polar amino acid transport system ATPase subunit